MTAAPPSRIAPCPDTPNCVSTEASDARHRMAPIPFTGDPGFAMARLERVLETLPRARVRRRGDGILHAEVVSRVFHFVDDVDFEVDAAAGVIRFRSASRIGAWDLGVNRRRMRRLRRAFLAAGEPRP